MTYQIRDGNFGLALAEGETPAAALASFLERRRRGELRELLQQIVTSEDGSTASVVYNGERLTAVSE